MATYKSAKVTANFPSRAKHGENEMFASVSISSAAASNDIAQFFTVPANATITGIFLSCTDIDTNGTPTVSIDVGDAGSTNRLIASSNIGQAGGSTISLDPTNGHGYTYTTDTLIYATIKTVATGATGTIKLSLRYIVANV